MDLTRARIALRTRSLFEVQDLAFQFLSSCDRGLFATLCLLVLMPGLGVATAVRLATGGDPLWVWAAALTYGSLARGVFTLTAGRLLFSERVRPHDVLYRFARQLPSYLSASLLGGVVVGVSGLSCLMAPWGLARFGFVAEACLLERFGPLAALKRSYQLTQGATARALLLTLLDVATTALVTLFTALILRAVVEDVLLLPWVEPYGGLYAIVGYFASVPLTAVTRFLAYIDGRTRRDGWDLQVRFLALATARSGGLA